MKAWIFVFSDSDIYVTIFLKRKEKQECERRYMAKS